MEKMQINITIKWNDDNGERGTLWLGRDGAFSSTANPSADG